MRPLILGVMCLTAVAAHAQADGPWMPAPMPTPAPLPGPAAPLPTDPIKLGVQFHGEFQGLVSGAGTSSLGVSASVGLGLNRLGILLTPAFTVASSIIAVSLGVSVRIYLKSRQQGVLVGFLEPSAQVGTLSSGGGIAALSVLYGGLGFAAGGEYLLTRNLGITAKLGLTFSSLGLAVGSSSFAAFTTVGAVGVMLHQ